MPRTMDEINLYQGTLRNFRIKRQRENHINYKRKKMVSLIERVRVKMTTGFSAAIMKARKQRHGIFKF